MPRRRELKGITINFAKLLSWRNNDYLGYWAVGQLSLLAQTNKVESISLDLSNLNNSIDSPQALEICQQMTTKLNRLLEAHKIPNAWIKSISVEFFLNLKYQEKYHYWRLTSGDYYLALVEIETDLGYINKAIEGGNVYPHDPTKEHRRNRLISH